MLSSNSRYDRHVPGENGNEQLIAAAERQLQELEQEREATLARIASLRELGDVAKTFDNRAGWAATHLYRVGLLARPRRSVYAITDRVATCSRRTQSGWTSEFSRGSPNSPSSGRRVRRREMPRRASRVAVIAETRTPEERIDAAYQELRQTLIADLRDRISAVSPAAFEEVLDVLHAMGYGDGTEHSRLRIGASGDAGIDGLIREDRLGLDVVYVRAKRWGATVGRPVVQGFVGALRGQRASKGIIFAASTFSADAREYAASASPRVVLVDGELLGCGLGKRSCRACLPGS